MKITYYKSYRLDQVLKEEEGERLTLPRVGDRHRYGPWDRRVERVERDMKADGETYKVVYAV